MKSPMHRFRTLPAAAALVGLLAAAACSSGSSNTAQASPSAQYCQAWADTVTAFASYREVDVVNGGLNSVRTYVSKLDAAVKTLRAAADEQLQSKVDGFTAALTNLGETLTSTALPVDRRAQVRAAADTVNARWNDVTAAASPACPSATLTPSR